MMNKRIISDCLIASFKDLPIKAQLTMTLNPEEVEKAIIETYDSDKWIELTRASSEDWRDAWRLFEQHHGIFTHLDYHEIMSK